MHFYGVMAWLREKPARGKVAKDYDQDISLWVQTCEAYSNKQVLSGVREWLRSLETRGCSMHVGESLNWWSIILGDM